MGLIKAFAGAIGGTFADQWKDYVVPMSGVPATAAVIPAVLSGTNAGRGSNTKGSEGLISNGSKIMVPDGMALITLQDGAITSVVTEPGGFIWNSDDPNSKSIFSGDGLVESLITQSWERFKYGGRPGAQQGAIYVNLREIPNNRFGTQNPVRWMDPFSETQMGAIMRGTYTLKIVDPIAFLKNYVPMAYVQQGKVFDFGDMQNPAGEQLFNEVVTCLSETFQNYIDDQKEQVKIGALQKDQVLLGNYLSAAVEKNYQWKTDRGLQVEKVSIMSLDYDEESMEIINQARKADVELRQRKKMGEAYSQNMAGMMSAAAGEAMQNAASNPNGSMMGFMGMNMASQTGANMMGAAANMQQQQQQQSQESAKQAEEDPYEKLAKLKKLLDQGVISQEEFDQAKAKLLGL